MADVQISPVSFGAELKDGFRPVNAWVGGGIAWLDDIQQFYRERSAIEKEYAAKLSALAKKYFEKKGKKSSSLSVGDTPTVTPGSLESASMTTWSTQLTTLESRAAEHDRFAAQLIGNLADPLKHLAVRSEELRKCHVDYAAKLEKERDGSYAELKKMKGKYDGVCQEVENRRKKTDTSFDSSKQKAQVAYQQQIADMHNVKNTYIISINVTNRQKERYYHEYVPELLDSLQDLNQTRVSKMNSIWSLAAEIEKGTLTRSTDFLNHLAAEIPRNNPSLDAMMFLKHNIITWQDPPDFSFEPSPVWLDDDAIASDEAAKNYLRNILTKSKSQLSDLNREVDKHRREVEGIRRQRENIRSGQDKGDEVELVRTMFALHEQLHNVERERNTADVEISTILTAVGDVSIGGRSHSFKSETFRIPTDCDYCGDRIWGLSAKGFNCKDCGYTCHSKCQMKAPADCPGEQSKEAKKKLKAERQEAAHAISVPNGGADGASNYSSNVSRSDTMNTLSSGYSATAHRSLSGAGMTSPAEDASPKDAAPKIGSTRRNRIVAPPPAHYAKDAAADEGSNGDLLKPNQQRGKMVYAYQQSGDGEITVEEGREITVIEPDDGSGWMKVRAGVLEGIVPAAYVELSAPMPASTGRPPSTYSNSSASLASSITTAGPVLGKKKGPAVAPKRGAKKLKYVEALYEYEARSDAEHSMQEGERFVLINKDTGDGWADVEKGGQVKSVPANYIQEM